MLTPQHRVAILLHEGIQGSSGKTGLALLRYREGKIVAVIDRDCAGQSLPTLTRIPRDVPIVASVTDALAYQPDVLAIGIAPSGGILPEDWRAELLQAVEAGLSIANGLHSRLGDDPDFQIRLQADDQWIWDMRQEPARLTVGTAKAQELDCLRVLAVGTDMAIGKMSTMLELDRAARQRGLRSKFLATGQAGMMISGSGIPLDAVRVDFASGAVEHLVLQGAIDQDIVWVEGQGSLLNPSSTATLPLIRGSQPTHLILVHKAGETHIHRCPHVPIPPLAAVVRLYEAIAASAGAFSEANVAAIALNTVNLDQAAAQAAIAQVQAETGLPCSDPVRFGVAPLLDAILSAH